MATNSLQRIYMRHLTQASAIDFSTFALPALLSNVYQCGSVEHLQQLELSEAPSIVGEGSNTIFLRDLTQPIVQFFGDSLQVDDSHELRVSIHVEAGYNWHQLVCHTVAKHWWGIENLALIPGSVGAAPVQNIGAYGVEFADVCDYVDFYEWQSKAVRRLTKAECLFGYRDSVFKQSLAAKGIIVAVGLTLQKQGSPCTSYKGLEHLTASSGVQQVMSTVIALRQSKLPDPKLLPNCGSFFKNPVLTQAQFALLATNFPAVPSYPQPDGKVKVAAGWLIEQAGFRGKRFGQVGSYDKQALVLVNWGGGTAEQLVTCIAAIQQKVSELFGVQLEPEVRLV